MWVSLTTEDLAGTRFGESYQVFALHVLIQFSLFFWHQVRRFLFLDQAHAPLPHLCGRIELSHLRAGHSTGHEFNDLLMRFGHSNIVTLNFRFAIQHA
jgi:hypothetical protein